MPFPRRKELIHVGRWEATKEELKSFESGVVSAEIA